MSMVQAMLVEQWQERKAGNVINIILQEQEMQNYVLVWYMITFKII